MSDKQGLTTKKLCMIAMLTAVTAVLAVFGTFRVGNVLKFPTKFISVFICGALFGPLAGGFSAAVGDILNVFLAPSGAWIPWLTLAEFVEGAIIGLFIYKKRFCGVSFVLRAAALSVIMFLISILFTTYVLTAYRYFPSFSAGLSVRLIPEIVKTAVKFCVMLFGMRFLPFFEKEIARS